MRRPIYFCLTGILLLLSACSKGTADQSESDEVVSWMLEEDLRIDEHADYYLGSVASVAVRADGTLLVADQEENHVKVISREGLLLRTLGRQGQGPGEFQGLLQASLARGDSLYVLDGMRKVSVFADTSYTLARTVQLAGDLEGRRSPTKLIVLPENGFLVSYGVPPILGGEGDPVLYRVREDGELMGLVDVPQQGQNRIQIQVERTVMPLDLPFDRRSVIALGPTGRLYHGITDSLAITVLKPSGEALYHWTLPAESRAVTENDLRTFAEDFAAAADEATRHSAREAIRDAVREAGLPETQPAFYDLLVDDRQRVWIRRDPEHVETAAWWIASTDGKLLGQVSLPGSVRLQTVRAGYVYGMISDSEVLPSVIRYRIKENPNNAHLTAHDLSGPQRQ